MVQKYKLIKDNYGLKKGTVFIYLECPNLYMRRTRKKINGEWKWGGDATYRFTPEQMDRRYFMQIKSNN